MTRYSVFRTRYLKSAGFTKLVALGYVDVPHVNDVFEESARRFGVPRDDLVIKRWENNDETEMADLNLAEKNHDRSYWKAKCVTRDETMRLERYGVRPSPDNPRQMCNNDSRNCSCNSCHARRGIPRRTADAGNVHPVPHSRNDEELPEGGTT